ncbi:MAG: hypothetical protein BWZ10_00298 [candidate division BRC1 bacterium ADurb.BinA364]|nr:MAG: hypothetical protein BWZ10_00298 [candidate division BRC1 bacterium ADurb.BinA364]
MLPNFLHLGAAKAASTYLWTIYQEHPEIYVPLKLEEGGRTTNADNPNFFVGTYHKGLDWYEKTFFAGWNGEKAVGETSNSYMLFEPALERIARDLPGVRVSMILRNPVEIAFLQYATNIKSQLINLERASLDKMLYSHSWQLFRMWAEPGFYASHIRRVLRFFPRERVHIAFYDDLCADSLAFVRSFFRFLEVDDRFAPAQTNTVIGFPGTSGSDTPEGTISKGIAPDLLEELRLVFREDIEQLEQLTGRDLSAWRRA